MAPYEASYGCVSGQHTSNAHKDIRPHPVKMRVEGYVVHYTAWTTNLEQNRVFCYSKTPEVHLLSLYIFCSQIHNIHTYTMYTFEMLVWMMKCLHHQTYALLYVTVHNPRVCHHMTATFLHFPCHKDSLTARRQSTGHTLPCLGTLHARAVIPKKAYHQRKHYITSSKGIYHHQRKRLH